MKKIGLIIIFVSSLILMKAQDTTSNQSLPQQTADTTTTEKVKKERTGGHYLSAGLGLGASGLDYNLKGLASDGTRNLRLGGNALIGYSYFFNKTIGIGTGVGVGYFRTVGRYQKGFSEDERVSLGNQIDDDFIPGAQTDYELRVRLGSWEERQTATYLEIPLLLQLQHRFGVTQKAGIYFNIGAKLQLPLSSKYEVLDGSYKSDERLNVSGFYGEPANMDMGAPGEQYLPYHGFGSIHNPNEALGWNDKMKLGISAAATAELGFLFALGKRVDLTLGAYIDYGFLNVKKGDSKALLEAPESYLPDANGNIGNNIVYNGMIQSDRVEKVKLLSYGGKIGIRVKLGEPHKFGSPESIIRETIIKDTCCCKDTVVAAPGAETVAKMRGIVRDVTDPSDIKYLDNAKVTAYNEGILIGDYETTNGGEFKFNLKSNQNYRIKAEYPDYLTSTLTMPTDVFEKDTVVEVYIDLMRLEINKVIELPIIFYNFDKWDILPESKDSLSGLVKLLKDNPNITIELLSHTDYRGAVWYNDILSQNRAQSCVDYLISQEITKDRLTAKGMGELTPKVVDVKLAKKHSFLKVGDVLTEKFIQSLPVEYREIANRINRRTEFKVLSTDYNQE